MLRVLKSLNKFKKVENDVIIYVGEGPDIKEFRSYSKTLCNKSEYFKKILSDENIEKENGSCIIKIPNINTEIFEIIIKNINGTEDLNKKTGIEILNIIIASDDLKLSYLVKQAEDFFMKHRQLLRNEPVEILQLTFHHKTFSKIRDFCLKTICSDPEILFNSDDFINLPATILEDILDRNDLNLIEIKIWDNLIKWISAQEKTLTKNQFNRFISLIRFYDISSEDYFHKVKPYKEFLSKDMQEEILKFHMIPEYKPILVNFLPRRNYSVTSILINQDHFALFANWIDRKHRYCNFILLYRASRDGKTAAAFHNRCDNRGATIVVVKIKNSEQIAGGYNPLSWDSSGSNKSTKESFLFNFMDKNDFQSANVVNSKGDQYSVRCRSHCGPYFGYRDFYINHNENDKNPDIWNSWYERSYPTLNLPNSFAVDDYEVFQVIKK
ncbi:hypothetical protein RclHR1_01450008 [Rhizophagus clarus]|uniref:TLDc domain-containing protein n=1 Tax=Rhizophagus clarus TaxID=94130 RepID=A0A2Z6QCP5_9GLOM|nr:hypothetical protein RclHR1_01450008 [Rhizophagus clarus]